MEFLKAVCLPSTIAESKDPKTENKHDCEIPGKIWLLIKKAILLLNRVLEIWL